MPFTSPHLVPRVSLGKMTGVSQEGRVMGGKAGEGRGGAEERRGEERGSAGMH